MSKAKKVKAGKLYTNGRAQVVYVVDVWDSPYWEDDSWCEFVPVQNTVKYCRNYDGGTAQIGLEEFTKRWPYVVDRIVIEQEDELFPPMNPERKR